MGLFDAFSSKSGKAYATDAYKAQNTANRQGYNAQNAAYKRSNVYNQTAYNNTLNNTMGYYDRANDYLTQGANTGYGYIDQGTQNAIGAYDNSISYWDPIYQTGMKGYGSYADAMGLNGQEGYDRSVNSFRTSPGYEFQTAQGQEAILRNANSRGMLSAGNTDIDLINYQQGLADQEWDDYLGRLEGFGGDAQNAAGAITGINTNKANTYYQQGTDKAGIATNTASQQSNNEQSRASALNDNEWKYAASKATTAKELGDIALEYYKSKGKTAQDYYADLAAAEQTANGNTWSAIMGLISGVSSAAGSYYGAKA